MRFTPSELTRVALIASTLFLPTAAVAQAVPDSGSCFAQPRARQDSLPPSAARDTIREAAPRGAPDVILFASVSARELRFQSQPRVSVRLCGGFDSVRVVERRNLPERVVPGVTYRDVHIAVEILGHIYADCLRESIVSARVPACPSSTDTARATPRRPQ
jgi:hypothetical protein